MSTNDLTKTSQFQANEIFEKYIFYPNASLQKLRSESFDWKICR